MKSRPLVSVLIGLMFAAIGGVAAASDDCPRAPREQWKPESEARAATEAMGYKVERVQDDGACYEIKATDKRGRRVEVKYSPTDMKLVSRQFKSELAAR